MQFSGVPALPGEQSRKHLPLEAFPVLSVSELRGTNCQCPDVQTEGGDREQRLPEQCGSLGHRSNESIGCGEGSEDTSPNPSKPAGGMHRASFL